MLTKLESTGERFLPEWGGISELEHVHRYLIAKGIAYNKAVLDIASGEGYGSNLLAKTASSVVGIDISSEAVRFAQEKYSTDNLDYIVGDCTNIPLPNASFDLVVSFETIEHHNQHDAMMREIKRVLKPDGVLILSSPDKYNYSEAPGIVNEFHVKELYENELRELMGTHFKSVEYLGQRVALGSLICSSTSPATIVTYSKSEDAFDKIEGISTPVFWLVVASDAKLPHLETGLFEHSENELEKLKAILIQRDNYIAHLTKTIDAIYRSRSWRITAPLRNLGKPFRRKIHSENPSLISKSLATSSPKPSDETPASTQNPQPTPVTSIQTSKPKTTKPHPLMTTAAIVDEQSIAAIDAFFTICAKNFLAHARTLYQSIRDFYPNTKFYVVLCDQVDDYFEPGDEPFEFIYLEDISLPNLEEMSSIYNITEFNTSVKPFAFLHLMNHLGFHSVVYLDPDLFFIDRLFEAETLLAQGAQAILTPHILQSAENDEINDRKILLYGIYNLGFLALRNTDTVRSFLSWWGRRLERECIIRLDKGIFVDQKWADLLPAFVPETKILHHPGYNVAYWNLPQRKISRSEGKWFANEAPLRFVHFSGNDLDDENTFSKHSRQLTIDNIGDLRELFEMYRENVRRNGHQFLRSLPYAYNRNGKRRISLPRLKEFARSKLQQYKRQRSKLKSRLKNTFISGRSIQGVSQKRSRELPHKNPQIFSFTGLRVAKQLSGGWRPLVDKTKSAYQRDGGRYVIKRAIEFSQYRMPRYSSSTKQAFKTSDHKTNDKNILYLDWGIPRPDIDAASVTAVQIISIFKALEYNVTFVPCNLKYFEDYYEALVESGVDVICYPEVLSVNDWLIENASNYGICFLARGPVVAPFVDTIKNMAPDMKLIFYTVDLHYLRYTRQARLENDEKGLQNAEQIKKTEIEVVNQCDLTIVLSDEELYTLRKEVPDARLVVLPLIFDDIPGAKNRLQNSFDSRDDIIFIGSFLHTPNVDAVLYFANDIFPLVLEKVPQARFVVIGANATKVINTLGERPNIKIYGHVKVLAPYFEQAKLSIAPLRYGAGIKGKIGTSFCFGVPCVATSIGIEGMALTPEHNVLIGDTAKNFANQIIRLYSDELTWQKLSNSGHHYALTNYSFATNKNRLNNILACVKNDWPTIENAVDIYDWHTYRKHQDRLRETYTARKYREQLLLPEKNNTTFDTKGYCCLCKKTTLFRTSFLYSVSLTETGRPMPNWREHMQCIHCGLNNRIRAALHLLHLTAYPKQSSHIYITEQLTSTYQWLQQRFANLQGSEYFGDQFSPGENVKGTQHENIVDLSFAANQFDHVLSFDVLEHVPQNINEAFKQIFRVLKNGGMFLFSVPFSASSRTNIVRASVNATGDIVHHLPAEYHGNPVDRQNGALCYRYFGWELLDSLRNTGFVKVRAVAYWSESQGYLGTEQFLFLAEKPSE